MVAGFLPCDRGEITVGDRPVKGRAATEAWCSRTSRSCPGRLSSTMWASGLKMRGIRSPSATESRREFPGARGPLARRRPLSQRALGGMQQRVGVVRALANEPRRAPHGRALRERRRADPHDSAGGTHPHLGRSGATRCSSSPTTSRGGVSWPIGWSFSRRAVLREICHASRHGLNALSRTIQALQRVLQMVRAHEVLRAILARTGVLGQCSPLLGWQLWLTSRTGKGRASCAPRPRVNVQVTLCLPPDASTC
jgi:hypothetical protein